MSYSTGSSVLASVVARNSDGTGNNIANTTWGSANGTYLRVTETTYGTSDGYDWGKPESAGGTLPDPSEVTTRILSDNSLIKNSFGDNEFSQFFGQFLAHDVAQARPGIPFVDEPLLDGGPFPMPRDAFIIDDEGVRQTITNTTGYLDLSTVYGKSDQVLNLLRETDSASLIIGADGRAPSIAEIALTHGEDAEAIIPLFAAVPVPDFFPATGDERAFQSPQLMSHQIVWLRNHNWHVEHLSAANPEWSADQIFDAARALNEAEYQKVVFEEYVANLLGDTALKAFDGYDDTVNASVTNEWTSTGNRFGHDQASDTITGIDESGASVFTFTLTETIALGGTAIQTEEDLSNWVRGQLAQSSQEIDGKIVDSAGRLELVPGLELNLKFLDIARARDHGNNEFNTLRVGLGLEAYESFDAFAAANNIDDTLLAVLKDVYNDDISILDSQVGGLLEKDVAGSQLGETFTTLSVQQFESLRDGDRFYYEERFKDSPELIAMIKETTLADILARTTDVEHIYHDAFAAHNRIGGTEKSEKLRGTDDADLIIGFAGNDKLYGNDGDDDLYGGDGRDYIRGGNDNDILKGGGGRDWLRGDHGDDHLSGGTGNDYLSGGRGEDTLSGDGGRDKLFGGSGDDVMMGGAGKDYLSGSHGDDTLLGGGDRDKLIGGSGDDLLNGGADNDWLWGGRGKDVFVFGEDAGRDTILDFNTHNDQIDLSAHGFETFAEVQAATSSKWWFFGSATIDLGDGDSIFLAGVSKHRLSEDDFIYAAPDADFGM